MTINEAIQYLSPIAENAVLEHYKEALTMATAALRAQQEAEKNEQLTLDELREMDGEPVWVVQSVSKDFSEFVGGYGVLDFNYSPNYKPAKLPVIWMAGCDEEFARGIENYGKTWLAYRHKPKEETKIE